ncbi:hypothetical protein GF337_16690 [candidate division KSB1 bacterium]|nr:hypothetical protein [candidate division KSB1 bacterium]
MTRVIKISAIFIAILITTCAVQRRPSGGPVDKEPPEIIGVYPAPNSTNIERDVKIVFEFSERLDKKSVTNSIFVSPRQEQELNYDWDGKKLNIEFPDSLQEDRTYVLTIGTDVVDLRRNRLASSFHLAFSTGTKLDQGRISGTVYSENSIEGVLVGMYAFINDEEPRPSQQFPEYTTQCNEKGEYQFSYIATGKYRLFALQDRDYDQKYTRGFDGIGIPTTDVTLTDEIQTVTDIDFQMTVFDTIPAMLRGVNPIDRHHLDVRFDAAVQPICYKPDQNYFTIFTEQEQSDTLPILNFYQNSGEASRFHLITAPQDSALTYLLFAQNIFDLAGNPLDTAYAVEQFTGSPLPDTIQPQLTYQSIDDGERDIPLEPEIELRFSEALAGSTLVNHFSMTDSANTKIKGAIDWLNPADLLFIPQNELISMMPYTIHIPVDSVFDQSGNSLADSSIRFTFITLKKDTLSSLSGKIIDNKEDAGGRYYVQATHTTNKDIVYYTSVDSAGQYLFRGIFPGIYTLYSFHDEDNNGEYSHGDVYPFHPAERFLFYPDSVKIRSRWINEGNSLIYNEY